MKTVFSKTYRKFLMKFIYGEQYINYTKYSNRIKSESIEDIPKDYYWQEREVYNIILPIYEKLKSKMDETQLLECIETLIPFQREYNRIKNKKSEYINRLVMGVVVVEDGSVDVDNLESEGVAPGKILVYRQGSTSPNIITPPYEAVITLQDIEDRLLKQFYDRVYRFGEGNNDSE